MTRIAALVVGNEILLGRTRDTNTQFLVEVLLERGLKLSRWIIVPDRKEDISRQLDQLAKEGFDLVIVSGGMGPTHDDITVDAVAAGLDLDLRHSSETFDRMMEKWKRRFPERDLPDASSKGVRKMSKIPDGFRPLWNRSGMAEGLTGKSKGGGRIVIVPGVPVEYKAVIGGDEFRDLLPRSDPDDQCIREIHFKGMESQVSASLEEHQERFPSLDIGSYPQGRMKVTVRITGRKEIADEACTSIGKDIAELEKINQRGKDD